MSINKKQILAKPCESCLVRSTCNKNRHCKLLYDYEEKLYIQSVKNDINKLLKKGGSNMTNEELERKILLNEFLCDLRADDIVERAIKYGDIDKIKIFNKYNILDTTKILLNGLFLNNLKIVKFALDNGATLNDVDEWVIDCSMKESKSIRNYLNKIRPKKIKHLENIKAGGWEDI